MNVLPQPHLPNAMMTTAQPLQLQALDIVLSCTICQEPLSSVYAEDDEYRGLNKGEGDPSSGRITKLWLTECAHLTCAKHLEGGGVSFHSSEQPPRAPCPLCALVKNDQAPKMLFFINGTADGEYDKQIPESYFRTPPVQLDGNNAGLEALRFQYLSLLRFGTKTYERLAKTDRALHRWEGKKVEIVNSLSNVAPLRDELISAGQRLLDLGQSTSSIETTLKLVGASLPRDSPRKLPQKSHSPNVNGSMITPSRSFAAGGSRLASASAADLDQLSRGRFLSDGRIGPHSSTSMLDTATDLGSSAKRRRIEMREDPESRIMPYSSRPCEKIQSRNMMPPPPLPRNTKPQPYTNGTPHSFQPQQVSPHWHRDPTSHLWPTPRQHGPRECEILQRPDLNNFSISKPLLLRGGERQRSVSFVSMEQQYTNDIPFASSTHFQQRQHPLYQRHQQTGRILSPSTTLEARELQTIPHYAALSRTAYPSTGGAGLSTHARSSSRLLSGQSPVTLNHHRQQLASSSSGCQAPVASPHFHPSHLNYSIPPPSRPGFSTTRVGQEDDSSRFNGMAEDPLWLGGIQREQPRGGGTPARDYQGLTRRYPYLR